MFRIPILLSAIAVVMFQINLKSAYALGLSVEVSKLEFLPKGAPYTGLGQTTRELRATESDVILVSYTKSGRQERLWDDDGLATLFLYHRDLTSRVFDKRLKGSDSIPVPTTAPLKAFDLLSAAYTKHLGSDSTEKVREIEKVKAQFIKAKTIEDLKKTDFEKLVNGLISNHSYSIETGEDKSIESQSLDQRFINDSPNSFTSSSASRSRDAINIDWQKVSRTFLRNSSGSGAKGVTD